MDVVGAAFNRLNDCNVLPGGQQRFPNVTAAQQLGDYYVTRPQDWGRIERINRG